MNQERFEKLKSVSASIGEARRLAIQINSLNDEEFKKFLERKIEKNLKK